MLQDRPQRRPAVHDTAHHEHVPRRQRQQQPAPRAAAAAIARHAARMRRFTRITLARGGRCDSGRACARFGASAPLPRGVGVFTGARESQLYRLYVTCVLLRKRGATWQDDVNTAAASALDVARSGRQGRTAVIRERDGQAESRPATQVRDGVAVPVRLNVVAEMVFEPTLDIFGRRSLLPRGDVVPRAPDS